MARRRDVRRFGRGPCVLGTRRDPSHWGEGFPYDVHAVAAIEQLGLDAPVTLLGGLAPCACDDLEAVRFTRGFLDAPDRFIRAALE